jgi:hypothetical protein
MGSGRPTNRVTISENFEWDEASEEIIGISDQSRRPDSDNEAKIDVYDDRQRHWFLSPLQPHVASRTFVSEDYVVVASLLSYFEASEQWRRGKPKSEVIRRKGKSKGKPYGRSKVWFKIAARRILGLHRNLKIVTRLYDEVRCGMFHSGFTYARVGLAHRLYAPVVIDPTDDYLYIDPYLLFEAVKADHDGYVAHLRGAADDDPVRAAFIKLWGIHWENS